MLKIEPCVLGHLIKMIDDELARQISVNDGLDPDDDWPPEYDPNDIGIYQIIQKALRVAETDPQHHLELGHLKVLHFFLMIIPQYVQNNLDSLTFEQFCIFRNLIEQNSAAHPWLLGKFPEWISHDVP